MDIRKQSFVMGAIGLSSILHKQFDLVDALATRYAIRGYGSQGSNPITDADLAEIGLTKTQFDELVSFYHNLLKFLDNQPVVQNNYRNILIDNSNDSY